MIRIQKLVYIWCKLFVKLLRHKFRSSLTIIKLYLLRIIFVREKNGGNCCTNLILTDITKVKLRNTRKCSFEITLLIETSPNVIINFNDHEITMIKFIFNFTSVLQWNECLGYIFFLEKWHIKMNLRKKNRDCFLWHKCFYFFINLI